MLHSDQSKNSQQGAHAAQRGFCATCGEKYGWWQGVVYDGKNGAGWRCAICAALFREVPPPEGYVTLRVHDSFWEAFALGKCKTPVESVRRYSHAMSFFLAWSYEMDWFSPAAFEQKLTLIPKELEQQWAENKLPPGTMSSIIFLKPLWWVQSRRPEAWAYQDGREERLFSGLMREALNPEDRENWCRFEFGHDLSGEPGWTGLLPNHHPQRGNGYTYAHLLHWSYFRLQFKTDRLNGEIPLFDRDALDRVEKGVSTALRELCYPIDATPPPLWEALDFHGAHRH